MTAVTARGARAGSPPAPTPRDTVIALVRTSDLVRRLTAHVVEPEGITLQQYNVLRILEDAGDDGLPTLEVGKRMIEQTPGVTRLLDRLETKGYIRRQRCPRDRRQHLCWVTPDGVRLLRRLSAPVLAAHDRTVRALDASDRRELLTLLERIRRSHE